jgi:hypothetical protein
MPDVALRIVGGVSYIIGFVSGAIEFIWESIRLADEPSKLYDTANVWIPVLTERQNFLQILEIPLVHGKSVELLKKVTDVVNVDDVFKDLPEQKTNTARLCFVENLNIYNRISSDAIQAFEGSSTIMSQLRSLSQKIQWETRSYKLSLYPTFRGTIKRAGNYIDSVAIAAGTIRRTLRNTIISADDTRLIGR